MIFPVPHSKNTNSVAYGNTNVLSYAKSGSAKIMPPDTSLTFHNKPVTHLAHSGVLNEDNFYASRANRRQAFSAVSAEAYLEARISFKPVYVHSEMLTRMQNVSNLSKDPPRFKDQIDLIA